MNDFNDFDSSAESMINTMLKAGINFLALDFDLTIVDVHTGGVWPGTPSELAQHIRPIFHSLITSALSHNMNLGKRIQFYDLQTLNG